MARFDDYEIDEGTSAKTIWDHVKELLMEGQSVEVMVTYDRDDEPVAYHLRVWDDVREDSSNDLGADPGEDY